MGCAPQNQRATTTAEMAERTMEPRTAALQLPMTSSMTKRMAEMGALKAAARPAAAPMGAKTAEACSGETEAAADERGDAGADLEGRIFRAERVAAADGEGGEQEFADHSTGRDVAVVDVEGGLGLVDAAAADLREDVASQQRDDDAGERWNDDEAELMRSGRGAAAAGR